MRRFDIDRFNDQNIVGFNPYAPIVISIPEIRTDEVTLELGNNGSGEIKVTLSECPKIERTAEKQLAKMCQEPLPMWDYYMWANQPVYTTSEWTINPEKVVVLTSDVNNGVLTWDVPEGRWVISRIAMASTGVTNSPATPAATGLEVDKMSKKHLQSHFDAYIGEILRRIPAEDRKTFRIVVEDSYETGGQNWTDGLIEKFTEQYGYSPLPYLPVLQGIPVGNNEESDRFLWDLRRLVADLIAYEYVGGLKEISNRHGLTTWLENYGHWGFPSEFLLYGGQSDEIAGEYWSEGTLGDIENRAASSCGHIYGKNKIQIIGLGIVGIYMLSQWNITARSPIILKILQFTFVYQLDAVISGRRAKQVPLWIVAVSSIIETAILLFAAVIVFQKSDLK